MKIWLEFFILCLVFSCSSTSRTKYQAFEKKQGYQDQEERGLRVATFQGNAYTKKADAELFAKFRAIEVCQGENKKLSHLLNVEDLSVSKDVVRSSSAGFPSYYYGMSPFYSRFHSGFGVGFSHMSTNSWQETYTYPNLQVTYHCADQVRGPEIILRKIPREEMKLLVKDLKGGLQVDRILEGSPNIKLIEVGDVLLKGQGQRIEEMADLLFLFDKHQIVEVDLLREGLRKKILLRSTDVSDQVKRAQEGILSSACGKRELKKHPLCKG
jgi:hypothetical protein